MNDFAEPGCFSAIGESGIASEKFFTRMLSLERKRAERSHRQFLLMLLDAGELFRERPQEVGAARDKIVEALLSSTRETDMSGWYRYPSVLGVILTEIDVENLTGTVNAILGKVNSALMVSFNLYQLNQIRVSFHLFPEDHHTQTPNPITADLKLYPDLSQQDRSQKMARLAKRAIDVLGSAFALALLSPLCAAIALAIKLTSQGPVFFRQDRLGQYGLPFTFLKFRSMYYQNDSAIHEEFVKQFIAGKSGGDPAAESSASSVYKLTGDPRITRVGRFLRKSSLDELPQLLNVLKGEMSLVGPRPPIPYEFAAYDIWHRRRLLTVKPGITGLWQVRGRSKTKFDEMVRLDLQYAQSWSLALDLKILLQTPRAIFSGEGAY